MIIAFGTDILGRGYSFLVLIDLENYLLCLFAAAVGEITAQVNRSVFALNIDRLDGGKVVKGVAHPVRDIEVVFVLMLQGIVEGARLSGVNIKVQTVFGKHFVVGGDDRLSNVDFIADRHVRRVVDSCCLFRNSFSLRRIFGFRIIPN